MAPTSPAKRVTRARAAKSLFSDTGGTSNKATEFKTTGARKAKAVDKTEESTTSLPKKPAKKSTAKAATSKATITVGPRRRVKVTPLVAPGPEEVEEAPVYRPTAENPTRVKKATTKVESAPTSRTGPKTSTRELPAESNLEEVKGPSKPRGRPRKAVVDAPEAAAKPEKTTRQTRKRADTDLESVNLPATTTALLKKKVTFQDLPDDDKENRPVPTKRGMKKREPITTSGLNARPVRKPAAATTRKKTALGKTEAQAAAALTPKKITQMARSSTPVDSDEDELSGGKTPLRDLSQSPRRNPLSVRAPSPIKKLDHAQILNATSPFKTITMSPPIRLPQSPFKNSLNVSPKRGESVSVFPVLSATVGVLRIDAATTQAETTLQQSPRRGVMDNSIFSQSTTKLQRSPYKPHLSQSPVRRLFSPARQSANEKTEVIESAASSCFRSSQSPVRSSKLHKVNQEELAFEKTQGIDFDESVMNFRSPVKLSRAVAYSLDGAEESPTRLAENVKDVAALPATPRGPWSKAEEAQFAPLDEQIMEPEQAETTGQNYSTNAEAEENPLLTANAASYLFSSYALQPEDESSEDELQADQTPQRSLFGDRASQLTKTDRDRLSSGLVKENGSKLGFTPLATQLSTWLASSPERPVKSDSHHKSGTFSPVATQHVPGKVQIGRQATPVNRQSVGARHSESARKSFATRSSLASSMTESPAAPSSFADEMAARDLGEQVEAQEIIGGGDIHDDEASATYEQHEVEQNEKNVDTGSLFVEMTADSLQPEDVLDEALSTTDVLEEPVMTDTAMLDFVNIAQEAEELAATADELPQSTASSDYGDENTVIITRQEELPVTDLVASEMQLLLQASQTEVAVEAAIVHESNEKAMEINTPMRPAFSQQRFANTVVSKVPLRPEGDISPIKNPKKRSRSLSAGPGSAKKSFLKSDAPSISKSNTVISSSPERQARSSPRSVAASTPGQVSFAISDFGDSTLDDIEIPNDLENELDDSIFSKVPSSIKSSKIRNTVATPSRTPLKAVGTGVLHGAVVYVDVHTTEGADASGIFVDLLTQMGAKCIREWKWNPRASFAADDVENMATPARIGITHVVYKDGGKRTLEKVRDAKGEVCCVGVAWVLDCERENKWLDESTYTIDTNIVPRGGSRRRKSMEPRTLVNDNGNLSAGRSHRSVSGEMTKEMRDELVHTPIRQPQSPLAQTAEIAPSAANDEDDNDGSPESDTDVNVHTATPTGFVQYDPSTSLSPKTPGLMQQQTAAGLVHQSAPPKQIRQGLFPTATAEDQPDEQTRHRLDAARRRTMNWRPRVASPLGK